MTTASITISPAPPLQTASDYAALREAGLAYIERYAHANWTDYNTHDPGITLLELLCYAITDLSLRTSLEMKDLLASSFRSREEMQESFLTAGKALTTGPVSDLDYRKVLIDTDGVRNAWLEPHSRTVYVNPRAKENSPNLSYDADIPLTSQLSFDLKGLYNIRVDFDPVFIQKRVANGLAPNEDDCRESILKTVRQTYQAHRNLCEDVVDVQAVPVQYILFCADIGLESDAKVADVYADILFRVQNYLAPPVKRYSLAEMQARTDADGKPLTIDRIFDGPRLENGFFDDDELEESELRTRVYASDLINIIMGIKGVKDVRQVLMNVFEPEEKPVILPDGADPVLPKKPCDGLKLRANGDQPWCLHIDPNHQPQLCIEKVALTFFKDIIPVGNRAHQIQALEKLDLLQEKAYQENRKLKEDLPVPIGEVYDLMAYQSIANDLPQNYGVGAAGLPASASPERKAQANQLKAYLLFFDQILANYLAQLANLKSFFSADSVRRTYFGQKVSSMVGVEELYANPHGLSNTINNVLAQQENFQNDATRKTRFLDHLLARFAENFSDYALLMHSMFGERGTAEIMDDKVSFIKEYGEIDRLKAYNYSQPAWQTDNVAGITRRLARLIGIRNTSYQAYYASSFRLGGISMEEGENRTLRYRFKFYNRDSNRTLLTSTESYESDVIAGEVMQRTIWPVPTKDRFVIENAGDQFSYTLRDNENKPIATCPEAEQPSSKAEAEATIEEIIETLIYRGEALFLVEHPLLLPENDLSNGPKAWMKAGVEPDGDYCEPLDPYSYRVSVILPGYTTRFRDIDYRRYIEKIIRTELPAHVLARICWVSRDQLRKFETAYQEWLEARAAACVVPTNPVLPDTVHEKTKALIDVLEHPDFHTIYETGVLHDCENEDEENPFILNRTVLGGSQATDQPES